MDPRAEALRQLREADAVMGHIIDLVGSLEAAAPAAPQAVAPAEIYGALVRAIVGQQLSGSAARAIHTRFLAHYENRTPTPAEVLASDPETLRAAAGLSRAKVSYLRSLAEHIESGELPLEQLQGMEDQEVVRRLTEVRGLGEWTAQMFLMFHLNRPDVLPTGDLGIRKAVQQHYSLPALPLPAELRVVAEPWRPHRTLACRYLWRSLDKPAKAV